MIQRLSPSGFPFVGAQGLSKQLSQIVTVPTAPSQVELGRLREIPTDDACFLIGVSGGILDQDIPPGTDLTIRVSIVDSANGSLVVQAGEETFGGPQSAGNPLTTFTFLPATIPLGTPPLIDLVFTAELSVGQLLTISRNNFAGVYVNPRLERPLTNL